MKSFIRKSLYSAIVFFGTLLVLSVGYTAWNSTMERASSGSTLNSGSWNTLVDNISDLDSRWSRNGLAIGYAGGNVGIGTTSPAAKLTVNQWVLRVQRNLGATPVGTVDDLLFASFFNLDKTGDPRIFDITTDSNNTAILRSVATNMALVGGNVGIGTATPPNTLTVNNTNLFNPVTNVNSAIMIGWTAGNGFGGGVLMKDGTYYSGMWSYNSGAGLSLSAGGTSAGFSSSSLNIISNGNVGIGIVAPQERLDLGGGNIKMGYQFYSNACTESATNCDQTCPAGTYVITGGCYANNQPLSESRPLSQTVWRVSTTGTAITWPYCSIICANIR